MRMEPILVTSAAERIHVIQSIDREFNHKRRMGLQSEAAPPAERRTTLIPPLVKPEAKAAPTPVKESPAERLKRLMREKLNATQQKDSAETERKREEAERERLLRLDDLRVQRMRAKSPGRYASLCAAVPRVAHSTQGCPPSLPRAPRAEQESVARAAAEKSQSQQVAAAAPEPLEEPEPRASVPLACTEVRAQPLACAPAHALQSPEPPAAQSLAAESVTSQSFTAESITAESEPQPQPIAIAQSQQCAHLFGSAVRSC